MLSPYTVLDLTDGRGELPGHLGHTPPVPALPSWAFALLALLLLGTGFWRLRVGRR